ncbi:MAG: imidazoleglycerol-phosphate dehydratase HisB [Spirochaetales bacterium]|jgi:imidazoleglycerol-phosphate dehydratase|nr:imidazoleglycerol-phosphate dehydratase HisB [Spirochaetales bacterium]
MTAVTVSRTTKETDISVSLTRGKEAVSIDTGLPFFDHMLTAMAFHGGFGLTLKARGDIAVDYHHLVEDTGLVLGEAFHKLLEQSGAIQRFGHAVIPMDDALSEAVIDAAERPCLVYQAAFPQEFSGNFPMALFKEFFYAFTQNARVNLHLLCRYGENSHHMAEALFKAFGKALCAAYTPRSGSREDMSTKGAL